MLTEPLPTTLDVRKAAARGVTVSGRVALEKLSRIRDILASDEGQIEVHCEFSRDEENRSVMAISLAGSLQVSCQRCLEPMPVEISSENRLAIIGDDEQAQSLPGSLEPLIVGEERCDLWAVVEDELMLGLPIVSYHDSDECRQLLEEYTAPSPAEESTEHDNPFKVLEQLKPGSKT